MKLTSVVAFVALLAFVATPALADPPIEDTFFATMDPLGNVVAGGGTGFNDGMWYEYPSGWWNQWFFDHPIRWDHYKWIRIEVTVTPIDPANQIIVAANWSDELWEEEFEPPLPPADDMVVRETFVDEVDLPVGEPVTYQFDYKILPYNPVWVSMDVRGQGYDITGWIWHWCIPKVPAVTEWGVFVMTLLVLSAGTIVFRRFRAVAA